MARQNIIHIEKGIHDLSSVVSQANLDNEDYIEIRGEGMRDTILRSSASGNILSFDGTTAIKGMLVIRDLCILATNTTSATIGLSIVNPRRLILENLLICGAYTDLNTPAPNATSNPPISGSKGLFIDEIGSGGAGNEHSIIKNVHCIGWDLGFDIFWDHALIMHTQARQCNNGYKVRGGQNLVFIHPHVFSTGGRGMEFTGSLTFPIEIIDFEDESKPLINGVTQKECSIYMSAEAPLTIHGCRLGTPLPTRSEMGTNYPIAGLTEYNYPVAKGTSSTLKFLTINDLVVSDLSSSGTGIDIIDTTKTGLEAIYASYPFERSSGGISIRMYDKHRRTWEIDALNTILNGKLLRLGSEVFIQYTNSALNVFGVSVNQYGTTSFGVQTLEGRYGQYSTNTLSDIAGIDTAVDVTQRDFTPLFQCKFKINTLSNIRMFIGLANTSLSDMLSSDSVLASYAGIRFSSSATDTTFKFINDNGSGVPSVIDSNVVVQANKSYIFTMLLDYHEARLNYWLSDGIYTSQIISKARTGDKMMGGSISLGICTGVKRLTTTDLNIKMFNIKVVHN